MNRRYQGPEVLPPAAEVRKRVEAHLESLPAWNPEPHEEECREPRPQSDPPHTSTRSS